MSFYSVDDLKDFGYLRIAGASPEIRVADIDYNLDQHLQLIKLAIQEGIELLIFPDLSLTGMTCQDLFRQDLLINKTKSALKKISKALDRVDLKIILTIPEKINGRLVKVLYLLSKNKSQAYLLPASEYSDLSRNFATVNQLSLQNFTDYEILNSDSILIFKDETFDTKFSLSIYQGITDLYTNYSNKPFKSNVNVVLSSSPELADVSNIESELSSFSNLMQTSIVYLSPSYGESTTDHVYSGRAYIYENSCKLSVAALYEADLMIADLDLQTLENSNHDLFNKNKKKSYQQNPVYKFIYETDEYSFEKTYQKKYVLYRKFPTNPFLPQSKEQYKNYFDSIFTMAAQALRKRLDHLNNPKVILGLSGGLDSTLALLIAMRCQTFLKKSNKNILCVSMPGFGTTKRTYNNTKDLAESCQTDYLEISIIDAVNQHFKDINHDPELHDVTYENSQARERTQILMDLANKKNAIVLGTGDLSESALGFVTYGGDHLSMYHINAGIPKTMIRYLVEYEAENYLNGDNGLGQDIKLANILFDILATPVSPELLPPDQGQIAQKTEHLVGPYELHDLFLYYFISYSFGPRKVLFIAEQTFPEKYERPTIIKWLKLFYKRFFANQFKRSSMPDGPIIGKITLSPRRGFAMPSDAVSKLWLDDLEALERN